MSMEDSFEIQHHGQEETIQLLFCPILRVDCIGERCMWWVRDWNEDKAKFQYNCAVSLIAIGINDEGLQRAGKKGSGI